MKIVISVLQERILHSIIPCWIPACFEILHGLPFVLCVDLHAPGLASFTLHRFEIRLGSILGAPVPTLETLRKILIDFLEMFFFVKDLSPGPEKADDAYLSPHLSGFDPEVCRTKSGTFVASTIVR